MKKEEFFCIFYCFIRLGGGGGGEIIQFLRDPIVGINDKERKKQGYYELMTGKSKIS